MCKLCRFKSSCSWTEYHPGLCSPFIHSIVSNDSGSRQWRLLSDFTDAQADLGICCLHMPEDKLLHDSALKKLILQCIFILAECQDGRKFIHPLWAGLGGSVGCAVRLETRRSRVKTPPRSATFFRGDWSWNIFYGHSLPSADSRRAVVSFWRKNVHNTGYPHRGLSLPSKCVVR